MNVHILIQYLYQEKKKEIARSFLSVIMTLSAIDVRMEFYARDFQYLFPFFPPSFLYIFIKVKFHGFDVAEERNVRWGKIPYLAKN